MHSVDDYRWLDSPEGQRYWFEVSREPNSNPSLVLKKLRNSLSPSQSSSLMEQLELLGLSSRKVSNPLDWFWTKQLLEQASDEQTALETAADFARGTEVIDICCGAGADSIAMSRNGLNVHAIDRCPVACYLTQRNSQRNQVIVNVLEQNAEDAPVTSQSYIHIDPDRRADGNRAVSFDRLSPTWSTISRMLDGCAGMSLKLAPGLRIEWQDMPRQIDHPPEAIRYISKDGSVRQQRWYWGLQRWPKNSITTSMHLNHPAAERATEFLRNSANTTANTRCVGHWFHETFLQSTMVRHHDDLFADAVHEFVADYDPSIRAAELAPSFAARYGWQLIDTESGYLTSVEPMTHPMVRWYQVVSNMSFDRKHLKAFSKQHAVRSWELKSRGVDVNLDDLRKSLVVDRSSNESMSILLTQFQGSYRALVCKELSNYSAGK